MTLIDALYEAGTRLVALAEAAPEALYPTGDGAFEFERTVSRLNEMSSPVLAGAGASTRTERHDFGRARRPKLRAINGDAHETRPPSLAVLAARPSPPPRLRPGRRARAPLERPDGRAEMPGRADRLAGLDVAGRPRTEGRPGLSARRRTAAALGR